MKPVVYASLDLGEVDHGPVVVEARLAVPCPEDANVVGGFGGRHIDVNVAIQLDGWDLNPKRDVLGSVRPWLFATQEEGGALVTLSST